MSKVIRKQRLGKSHFKSNKMWKVGKTTIPRVSAPTKATISSILHERGRGAPLAVLSYSTDSAYKGLICAPEGCYVGQVLQLGDSKGSLEVGNCLSLGAIPEGTVVSSVEERPYDGGKYARGSGCYVTVVSHNRDTNQTVIKLPSGTKKTINSDCRAIVGLVSGGGRNEKPLLKAGVAYHKYKSKGMYWPRVRGVAMNPVEHPHGGGNHQHIGRASTVSRHAPPGQKVGLIAARRTGLKRGSGRE